ncbi:AhpA/YtjB family protein [Colwellia sp. E150_009]
MMNKLEQPLYPKLSSIYNKILQLVSAILLMIMLMVFLVANTEKSSQVLEEHFKQVADKILQQTMSGVQVLLSENSSSISNKDREAQLQSYLNIIANADYIKQAHLYDETGLLMLESELGGEASSSIKLLYGIDKNVKTLDKSKQYVPFIKEIRHEKLLGYIRITIEKSYLTSELAKNSYESQTLYRLLLIVAGLIGFLLTRGVNRFSRQGYRVPAMTPLAKK